MPHILCFLNNHHLCRLLDIVHADQKLYLVFEFLDVDLKRFMEQCNQDEGGMSMDLVKVCNPVFQLPARLSLDYHILLDYPLTHSNRRIFYGVGWKGINDSILACVGSIPKPI
jgi:hypothetical protein